jgi:membrane-bound ClpP family serine protease
VDQVTQIFGALCILAAFVGAQFAWLTTTSWWYLVLNVVGSAILAILAWFAAQWGFLLLEGVWALVSAWSLIRKLQGRDAATTSNT